MLFCNLFIERPSYLGVYSTCTKCYCLYTHYTTLPHVISSSLA